MASSSLQASEHHEIPEMKKRRIFTPLLYFILWCGCIISQSMLVSGFLNVVISSVQVEYQLSSAEAAMFPSDYDITVAVTVLLVSHFGKAHKPRTLGIGMIVLALGSFLFALPNFIYANKQEAESEELYTCVPGPSNTTLDCSKSSGGGSTGAYILLTMGSVLIGLGASPVYTAGTTFCDEIFSPNQVSVYFGISYAIGAAAPALGFILAGIFLGYYKTLGEPPAGMDYNNPNWVGAWWLGFLICAIMAFLVGLILLLFPAQLPECEIIKKKKLALNIQVMGDNEEAAVPSAEEKKLTFVELLWEMLPLLKSILTNPVYVIVVLASVTDSLIVSAFAAFLPKMVESQFRVSSSIAAYVTGGVIVPGAAGGIMMSGMIVKWRKLTGLECAKYQAWIGVMCLVVQLGFFIHCPNIPIDGVNANGSCSVAADLCANCPGTEVYSPVCVDGVTYTSPCDAACLFYDNVTLEYSDCCGKGLEAVAGSCESGCNAMIPFIIFLFFIMFFTFLNNIIFLNVNLRCVRDSERVMAISLQSVAFRVLGSFPGPIILGAFLDEACILWNTDECGERGACQEYDNKKIMTAAVSLAMLGKFVGTVLYFIGWRVWEKKDAKHTNVTYSDAIKNSHEPEEGDVVVENNNINKNSNGVHNAAADVSNDHDVSNDVMHEIAI